MLNKKVFDCDSLIDEVEGVTYGRPLKGQPVKTIEILKFRPDSDYPFWYVQHLRDARNIKFSIFNDLVPGKASASPPPPDKTPATRTVTYEDHCADMNTFKPFDYAHASKDIQTFCHSGLDLLPAALLRTTFDHTHDDFNMKIHLGI